MRILIVNSEYPPVGGGAGNASAHLARELASIGHEIIVMTAGYAGLPRDSVEDGVRVLRLPSLRRKADRSSVGEQLIFMLVASLWGLPWLKKLRPDLVLAFFGVPSGAAAWFWRFFDRTPYIVSLRGGDVPGFRPYDFAVFHKLLSPLLRAVWARAAAVVANSDGLRALALEFQPGKDIAVIPNGVHPADFASVEHSWQPTRLLFVGRLVYQKGLDLLLDALSGLADLGWSLELVGDGPRRGWLAERISELGLSERIALPGWKKHEELPAIYARANLFVNPSRHEGMSNAVLEAMAAGLPVLATRIAGNEELILQDQTGVLVPAEDAAALQTALRALIPDAAGRQRMGAAARKLVLENYTWRRVAEEYLSLAEQIRTDS